jgi:hypothetical protein
VTNPSSPWYTESTIPPLDYVPVTPTPRKYVRRGLKRAAIAGISAAAAIGIILVFPLVVVTVAVLGAFWWLFCRLFAR